MTSKTITVRNFPCALMHCPFVLTSLKAGLVSNAESALKLTVQSCVGVYRIGLCRSLQDSLV